MSQESLERIAQALKSGRWTVNALDDGSGVLLDLDGEQLLTLNSSAMLLIRAIESGVRDAGALAQTLVRSYSVEVATAEADTAAFVERLAAAL